MTTELLDLTLKFFAEKRILPWTESDVFNFLKGATAGKTDRDSARLMIFKLVKDGLVQIHKEQEFQGTLDASGEPKMFTKIVYFLTYDGMQFYRSGGFAVHEAEEKKQQEKEKDKLHTELEFVKESKNMIPFQKTQSWVAVGVSFVSLIFILISTYQGCTDEQAKELRAIKTELQKMRESKTETKQNVQNLIPPTKLKRDSIPK